MDARTKLTSLLVAVGVSLLPMANQAVAEVPIPAWKRLSTSTGDLPPADVGDQTSTLILDVDRDGRNDIVIAGWGEPSMIWYRHRGEHWDRYLIDAGTQYIEAGGDFFDIDGDGDLDIVQGGDYRTLKEVWWWENPHPDFDPRVPWKRRYVKNSDEGGRSHHDQMFGDFYGTGKAQLVFWNQLAGKLFLAEIPPNPRQAASWPLRSIYDFEVPKAGKFEGLATGDVDRDGRLDVVGAGRWFRNIDGKRFATAEIDAGYHGSRSGVGDFVAGAWREVVISPGDGIGPLNWYEWKNGKWIKHTLIEKVLYGHSLQVADINGDGHADIFNAEMDSAEMGTPGHECEMWIFYGNGKGEFIKTIVQKGLGNHESKLGDLDGDGDLDIVQKPFRQAPGRIDIWLNMGASAQKGSARD